MIGAILGDVVGSIYEFDNIKTKEFELFDRDCFFTDDSVMTIAIAEALMQTPYINDGNVEEFKARLIDAMHTIGRKYPDCGYGGHFLVWILRNKREPYNSFGNGSAMRVSSVGWYAKTLEEAEFIAKATAEVSHNHPEGIKGAIATAGAVFLARTGATIDEIKQYISKYYTIDFTIGEIRQVYEYDITCQGTVPQAMQAFFEATSFEDAIRNAISIGGDSDTVASITGAVAEAYYGITEDLKETTLSYLDDMLLDIVERFEEKFLSQNSDKTAMNRIVDIHMHIVPGLDDGARSIEESLEMLQLSAKHGVTDVFCTSHNGYSLEDGERYKEQLIILRDQAKSAGINIKLHQGCEILCASDYIDDVIYGLDIGAFSTLGDTKYVLAELYPDTRPSEALMIIEALNKNGYKPIIAHMERNYNITGLMVSTLIMRGALIQVNACSFVEESDEQTKMRARELLMNRYIHFIGSDAHRLDHRPPMLNSGIQYILKNTDSKYAAEIFSGRAVLQC